MCTRARWAELSTSSEAELVVSKLLCGRWLHVIMRAKAEEELKKYTECPYIFRAGAARGMD
jgi:hypothetical protein